MHFRLRYITAGFEFGDAQIEVSDPVKQIRVALSKRPATDISPAPVAPDDGVAVATCQRQMPDRLRDEAAASGKLSVKKESVSKVKNEMTSLVLHTLRLVRWRTDSPKSPPNPIRWFIEFSWSLDGIEWKWVADTIRLDMEWGVHPQWTNEAAEFVQTEALTYLDEPLGHELLREASANRKANPRSSLVLAVAAAEVSFKQFVARMVPDGAWILELPTPPLIDMLAAFPWLTLKAKINGKAVIIPDPIKNQLKKAIMLRNKIVHAGTVELKKETLDSVLTSVHDFLYFLDAISGQKWALKHISLETLKQFASTAAAP